MPAALAQSPSAPPRAPTAPAKMLAPSSSSSSPSSSSPAAVHPRRGGGGRPPRTSTSPVRSSPLSLSLRPQQQQQHVQKQQILQETAHSQSAPASHYSRAGGGTPSPPPPPPPPPTPAAAVSAATTRATTTTTATATMRPRGRASGATREGTVPVRLFFAERDLPETRGCPTYLSIYALATEDAAAAPRVELQQEHEHQPQQHETSTHRQDLAKAKAAPATAGNERAVELPDPAPHGRTNRPASAASAECSRAKGPSPSVRARTATLKSLSARKLSVSRSSSPPLSPDPRTRPDLQMATNLHGSRDHQRELGGGGGGEGGAGGGGGGGDIDDDHRRHQPENAEHGLGQRITRRALSERARTADRQQSATFDQQRLGSSGRHRSAPMSNGGLTPSPSGRGGGLRDFSRRPSPPLSPNKTRASARAPFAPRHMPVGHTSDWVRVGRTEIFRFQRPLDSPLEYATPITLSYVPGRRRTLYLCVYSVPKRVGMPHVLVAFAEVQLQDIVHANGARLTVPIQVPTPLPDANGKVHDVKVKPTAALFVSGEPTRKQAAPARYTIGLTSNFIEKPLALGRTYRVNRAFYTIHVSLGLHALGSEVAEDPSREHSGRHPATNSTTSFLYNDPAAAEDDTPDGDADPAESSEQENTPDLDLRGTDLEKSTRLKSARKASRKSTRKNGRREKYADQDADSDRWALVFRSDCVTRVNRKASGGTVDINYFSTKPLVSIPGITIQDPDDKAPEPSALDVLSMKLGVKPDKSQLFSLPNGEFLSTSPDQRIKLSVYDERKYQLLGHMTFTLRELTDMDLGVTRPLVGLTKRERRVVGTACLTQVEHGEDPRYFGFRVNLPWLE